MIKFRKSNPLNKWDAKNKEEKIETCFEYGKSGHYKNDSPSLTKHKVKQSFYTSKSQDKGHKTYILLEEDEDSLSPKSILDEEAAIFV